MVMVGTYRRSSVLSGRRSRCQVMLASGTPLIWQVSLATPPSATATDCGWDRNLGSAERGGVGQVNDRRRGVWVCVCVN